MVLAAAGAVDHDELVGLASKAFASVPDEDRTVRQLVAAAPAHFTGSSVYDRSPDTEQCCFAVAWKGASWTDPDSVPLMVMQTMLGGWDKNNAVGRHAGSLLTQKIAADREPPCFCLFYCFTEKLAAAAAAAVAARGQRGDLQRGGQSAKHTGSTPSREHQSPPTTTLNNTPQQQ